MAIRLLSEQLAAKIAAGEVVERPASVAKELIENSLDAGATRVQVDVKGGGVDLIRVVDNGSGMEEDEIPLAFQRHATSKLTDASGLDSIGTLGFRGEALPSIASVAQVRLVSRRESSPSGWEIALKWGRIERHGPIGCAPGTMVTVEGLFENVPARRKFLRSNSAEAGRIRTLVSRLALAYPQSCDPPYGGGTGGSKLRRQRACGRRAGFCLRAAGGQGRAGRGMGGLYR